MSDKVRLALVGCGGIAKSHRNGYKALMACGDRVLTREELLEKAWGMDSSLEVETRTVDVHIGTLRRKLGKEGRRILTVKNSGYRFDAE